MTAVQKPSPSNPVPESPRRELAPRRAALLLLAGVVLLYGVRLGGLDFWAPDEPRYGAIAEELRSFRHAATGLVLLHLNDAPYTQKPPLYFWLAALAGVPGRFVTEGAARLPSALAGIVSVGLTALIGRWLLGHALTAILAAGILATSFRFAFTARRAQLDVLLTCFELIAIAIFVFIEFRRNAPESEPFGAGCRCRDAANPSSERADATPSTWAIAGLHSALGAAALVKGPVGWLPLALFAGYLAWEGRFHDFRRFVPAWSLSLSVAPVCLWIGAAILLAPPGFAKTALGENLVGRFFAGTAHVRPFYYFVFQTPADFLPWTLLLPFGLARAGEWLHPRVDADPSPRPGTKSAIRFLLIWIVVPLLFFSVSAGKRGLYLLPVFPALALLTSLGATHLDSAGRANSRWMRRTAWAIGILASIELGLFVLGAPFLEAEKSPRPIAQVIARASDADEAIGIYALEPIEGAIAYYGRRKIVSIRDEATLQAFFHQGGRLVLMRTGHFEALHPRLGLTQIARFRSGRRALILALGKPVEPLGDSPIFSIEAGIESP